MSFLSSSFGTNATTFLTDVYRELELIYLPFLISLLLDCFRVRADDQVMIPHSLDFFFCFFDIHCIYLLLLNSLVWGSKFNVISHLALSCDHWFLLVPST
jgi:hypothetical protein